MKSVRYLIILLLIGSALAGAACSRKKTGADVPPQVSFAEIGDTFFDRGDYREAARAYQLHLSATPEGPQDRIVFRYAVASLSTSSDPESVAAAQSALEQLLTEYPQSSFIAEARLFSGFLRRAQELEEERRELEARLRDLEARMVEEIPKELPKSDFELAESALREGNSAAAAQHYQNYLREELEGERSAEAMLRLALIYLTDRGNSDHKEEAGQLLNDLIERYPHSPFRAHAEMLRGLFRQLSQLKVDLQVTQIRMREISEELEALKAIDRRRPVR